MHFFLSIFNTNQLVTVYKYPEHEALSSSMGACMYVGVCVCVLHMCVW